MKEKKIDNLRIENPYLKFIMPIVFSEFMLKVKLADKLSQLEEKK